MEGGPSHIISLKVMRVSRPSLSAAWEPFYSSSPSFSAHSTASVMSLQGKDPLPRHPKTLRDLTNVTEMLMLPAAFGSIQLGETFSSCLAVNNDSAVPVEGVSLKVEMQTATTKTSLAEYGGPDLQLEAGGTLEKVVHHEIKELGQHVLACTVSYHPPSSSTRAYTGDTTNIQSFRKFYKFAVTNPLSVKTKVHVPRSPSALLSSVEREKIFLEVHIQNLTEDAMWLQRMKFESVDNWEVQEGHAPQTSSSSQEDTIFSGTMSLMQPQDMRQYIYILKPKSIPNFPVAHLPGTVIPLGRLDISWRSSLGEPGRLLTSMLSRRIPLVQPLQPPPSQAPIPPPKQPSALPLHLQRSSTIGHVPSRSQSPQPNQRPMSPPVTATPIPYRPASPFNRNRTNSLGPISPLPQSPLPPPTPTTFSRRLGESIEVDLIVKNIPRDTLAVEKPFKVSLQATISAPVPIVPVGQPQKHRVLSLVVQHTMPPQPPPDSGLLAPVLPGRASTEPWSPRLPSSGFSTPSPYATPWRGDFHDALSQRLLQASETIIDVDSDGSSDGDEVETGLETPAPPSQRHFFADVPLPPPYMTVEQGSEKKIKYPPDIMFLGSSALHLPPIRLAPSASDISSTERTPGHDRNVSDATITTDSETDSDSEALVGGGKVVRIVASQDFELQYLPLKSGFASIGGLRILLVEDRMELSDELSVREAGVRRQEPRTLKELEVIAEVWVKASV
ncbi:hypothetical protein C8Q75DRAFT_844974 [Abortiporus biennis]|nr:hypothetical protein C8Q75DRAFT_844974 [Abortiporus biennis]